MTNSFPISKFSFAAVTLSLVGLMPCLAQAQLSTTSGSFGAAANVVQPLTITSTNTLNFGSFVAGSGGTVTIPSDAPYTRTSSSTDAKLPLSLVNSNAGGVSTIAISGLAGTTYNLGLPRSITLSSSTGGATMTISSFSTNLRNDTVIPDSGAQTFQIGGVLVVAPNQTSGAYTGTVPITITYQ